MSSILKIILFIALVLVAIKMFSPETADDIIDGFNESTGIEESILEDKLDEATESVEDKVSDLKDNAIDKVEETLEQ